MDTFNKYSRYYDLLYEDKNYSMETECIISYINKYSNSAKSILDLGCGTGNHLRCFADKGYGPLSGVDISEQMIEIAKQKNPLIAFYCSDITNVKLEQRFDVVTSLFHVACYQTQNEKLFNMFQMAHSQLTDGGLFIFDCWYGPAVLTDRPAVRVKRLENDYTKIIRISEPILHPNEDTVDVNFSIVLINKQDGSTNEFKEKHRLRYLFKPEVEYLLNNSGFDLLECVPFMSDSLLGFNSWNVIFIAIKNTI